MNKKGYEKPTMTVVKLQNKCQILAGSLTSVSRTDYGEANVGVVDPENLVGGEWLWN